MKKLQFKMAIEKLEAVSPKHPLPIPDCPWGSVGAIEPFKINY